MDIGDIPVGRIRERREVLRSGGLVGLDLDNQSEISFWGSLYLDGEVCAKSIRPVPAPQPPEAVSPGEYAGLG